MQEFQGEFKTRMFQSLLCFERIFPCDLWIQGKESYVSFPQQAALEAEGHANLSTGWLAGKTALMDIGLGCSKSFFW